MLGAIVALAYPSSALAQTFSVQQKWIEAFPGPASNTPPPPKALDHANDVVVSPDGLYAFVTGQHFLSDTQSVIFIAKYDLATGSEIAHIEWPPSPNGLYSGTALAIGPHRIGLPTGPIYVTAVAPMTATSPVHTDFVTLRFEDDLSQSTPVWQAWFDGDGLDNAPVGVVATTLFAPASVVVTGRSERLDALQTDYSTVCYNADTGGRFWQMYYDGPSHYNDVPVGLGLGKDDAYVVVGGTSNVAQNGDVTGDYATIAYNVADGALSWGSVQPGGVRRYDNGGDDVATGIAVHSENQGGGGDWVYVTGYSQGTDGVHYDYATVKYLALGYDGWVDAQGHGAASRLSLAPDYDCYAASISSRYAKIGGGDFESIAWITGTRVPTNDIITGNDYFTEVLVDSHGTDLPTVYSGTFDRGPDDHGITVSVAAPGSEEETPDGYVSGRTMGSHSVDIGSLRHRWNSGDRIGFSSTVPPDPTLWPQFVQGTAFAPSIPTKNVAYWFTPTNKGNILVCGQAPNSLKGTDAALVDYEETGTP